MFLKQIFFQLLTFIKSFPLIKNKKKISESQILQAYFLAGHLKKEHLTLHKAALLMLTKNST